MKVKFNNGSIVDLSRLTDENLKVESIEISGEFYTTKELEKRIVVPDCILLAAGFSWRTNLRSLCDSSGQMVKLPTLQNKFIEQLVLADSKVLTFDQIRENVWDGKHATKDSIRMIVAKLRSITHKKLIVNHSGIGYRIGVPPCLEN